MGHYYTIDVNFVDAFVETQHPRGQPKNAGQFVEAHNFAAKFGAKPEHLREQGADLVGNVPFDPAKKQDYINVLLQHGFNPPSKYTSYQHPNGHVVWFDPNQIVLHLKKHGKGLTPKTTTGDPTSSPAVVVKLAEKAQGLLVKPEIVDYQNQMSDVESTETVEVNPSKMQIQKMLSKAGNGGLRIVRAGENVAVSKAYGTIHSEMVFSLLDANSPFSKKLNLEEIEDEYSADRLFLNTGSGPDFPYKLGSYNFNVTSRSKEGERIGNKPLPLSKWPLALKQLL